MILHRSDHVAMIRALRNASPYIRLYKGKIFVVGYDATPEARTAIKSGDMYGDAIQHPDQIGAKTIDAIHDYFSGKTPAAKISVPVGTFTKADAK